MVSVSWFVIAILVLLVSILCVLYRIMNILKEMNGGEPSKDDTLRLSFRDMKMKK